MAFDRKRRCAETLGVRSVRHWLKPLATLVAAGYTTVTPTEILPGLVHSADKQANRPKDISKEDTLPPNLQRALAAVASGRYLLAEQALQRITELEPHNRIRAELGLSEIESMTGRGERALARAQPHCRLGAPWAAEACGVAVEVLRRRGASDQAYQLLLPFVGSGASRRQRLQLAEVLADRGSVDAARDLYRGLVDDFELAHTTAAEDAGELAIAGRAAHRLLAFREAGEFFSHSAMTGVAGLETLLWQGELALDAHDPDHARDAADDALRFAPDHPAALLLSARVRLSATNDGEQAEQQAERVLQIDPTRADAFAILAGLALRDLDIERAESAIRQGLEREPRHLELLSLRAVSRFLADDQRGFEEAVSEVLRLNPRYSTLYRLIAEYAAAEHRYEETIPLLRHAIALDPDDSSVRAELGIQLLRSGDEKEGRKQLTLAFAQNPFDLRVRNTLVLYDKSLDQNYSVLHHGQFSILLPNVWRELLSAIIPLWLDRAVAELQKHYGRLGQPRISVELYQDQDGFGVRTSGVPSTLLQGACFGTTIVARLPTDEPTNLGMTLTHELSHVYHLRASHYRVPRWFTEGLAEVETARRRSEWSREQDLVVYQALRAGRLPSIAQMNRAFSHAATLDQLAVAYGASAYLVDYILRSYGYQHITKMLQLWGQHQSTADVIVSALSTDPEQIDRGFRDDLSKRFAHFGAQYFPPDDSASIELARAKVQADPDSPVALCALAQAELHMGRVAAARRVIAEAPSSLRKNANLLWVTSMAELADQKPEPAEQALLRMIADGHDGYFVRMQLALVARMKADVLREQEELARAHGFHPTASEPLYRLAAIANAAQDRRAELVAMVGLAKLEESDVRIHCRLVELRLELGQPNDARSAAEALAYVNPLDPEVHRLLARVAWANRDRVGALRELHYARNLMPTAGQRAEIDGMISSVTEGQSRNRRN
jgi:cellulose synthase operon protein C